MRNWRDLLPEMLHIICNHVGSFKDLVAFGGVCSNWRHVAVEQNKYKPLLPLPWLMLAENQHDDFREFYSVTEGKNYSLERPEFRGKRCLETKGWIVTMSDKGEMALVHPLTRVNIPLPHQNTSECSDKHPMDPLIFVQYVVLSSPPKHEIDTDCVLMILHGGMGDIGFCRPGDKVWTVVNNNNHPPNCGNQSLEFYRGKFYVMDNNGEVWECDVIGQSGPISPTKIGVNIHPYEHCSQTFIVKSAGSLLVVTRKAVVEEERIICSEFCVLAIDVEHGGYKLVKSLGTRAIFLGHSATLSVDTLWYPTLIPNSIYFTDDFYETYYEENEGGGNNMGVFNLGDNSVQPHYSGKSLSFVCPPLWTFLTSR